MVRVAHVTCQGFWEETEKRRQAAKLSSKCERRTKGSPHNFVYICRLPKKIADFHGAPLTLSKGWPGVVRKEEEASNKRNDTQFSDMFLANLGFITH